MNKCLNMCPCCNRHGCCCLPCISAGPAGPAGPTGGTGSTGATGPTGPTGAIVTATNMSAHITDGILTVAAGGTILPLPEQQILNGFTVDGTNAQFTASVAGAYLISYGLTLAPGAALTTGVTLAGTVIPASQVTSTEALTNYTSMFIVNLAAVSTLQLKLFAAANTNINLISAYLNAVRLS